MNRIRRNLLGLMALSPLLGDKGAMFGLVSDSVASLRTKPQGFEYVPGNIFGSAVSGKARHNIDLEREFHLMYLSDTGEQGDLLDIWVDPIDGSDSNSGSIHSPVKTVRHAVRIAHGTVWLKSGRYTEQFDVRHTDRQMRNGQSRALMIKGSGGPVLFVGPGQQPSEMTWVLNGAVWEATPAGGETVEVILFIDGGHEKPIQYKTSEVELASCDSGWHQNSRTKKIFVRYEGRDLTLSKDKLEIFYVSSGNIVLGAKLFLSGITFRGGPQFNIWYQNGMRPIFYAKDCVFEYLQGANVATQGAICFTQNCVSRRALVNDGFNYYDSIADGDIPGGIPTQALEIDNSAIENGVPECVGFVNFPSNQYRNKQGSSGHETTLICRINGLYEGNYGQNIADTGINSRTWMVGTELRSPRNGLAEDGAQIGYPNLWAEGITWLDTVTSTGPYSTDGLYVRSGPCRIYRCSFSGTAANTFQEPGALIAEYDALAKVIKA